MKRMNIKSYYLNKLSAERLQQCYDIAPPRAKQYLDAEIQYVVNKIRPSDIVLELGCGYGRVLEKLSARAKMVIGIDISQASLELAKKLLSRISNFHLFQMNAIALGFRDRSFNVVICIQNGISAFKVSHRDLIRESIRVTQAGGMILFSSYSDKFWKDRLEWFHLQSKKGLIGEIDWDATRDGVIVCKDGFKATTVRTSEFLSLTSEFDIKPKIEEVDDSSIFYEILVSQ
ncbi:MAG: class I SAM-dependent methyltransferase [Candidatus Methanofastidiosia archaeon]